MALTDNGNQQISFLYSQQLSSILGNMLLFETVPIGVSNASGTTVVVSNSNLSVTIPKGTTFTFWRTTSDPAGLSRDTIVKIVLGSSATFIGPTVANAIAESTSTGWHVIANYTVGSSVNYLDFYLKTDADLATAKATDGTNTHQLVVASFLNHKVARIGSLTGGSPTTTDYRVALSYQDQRDFLPRLKKDNVSFNVDFEGEGKGVYISSGNLSSGDVLSSLDFKFGSSGTQLFPPVSSISAGGTTNFIPVASAISDYYPNPYTNQKITIGTTNYPLASFYQVDFLRIKGVEKSHKVQAGWDSFLVPSTTSLMPTLFPSSVTLTDTSSIQAFLSQFSLPLSEDGTTLLVAIRDRSSINSLNVIWPSSSVSGCLLLKDLGTIGTESVKKHVRLKLPVWNSSDLGYTL